MCSSMLLVVQSTIITPSMVRGSAPRPTTISFVFARSCAAAGATSEATMATTSATTTRPRLLPMRVSPGCGIGWGRSVARAPSAAQRQADEAPESDGLADVRGVVPDGGLAQLVAARVTLPRPMTYALDPVVVRSERPDRGGARRVREAQDLVPRAGGQRLDDLARAHSDGRAIALHRRHIRLLAQRGDLLRGHAGAHVRARNVHAPG